MKIAMGEVLLLSEIVEKLLYVNGSQRKMPFKVRLKLVKAFDKLKKELSLGYEDERKSLIMEFGEEFEDENGNKNHRVKEDNLTEFYKKMSEVLATETELDIESSVITSKELDIIEGDVEVEDAAILAFEKYLMRKED